ncbi:amidophosphoribosyltransferase [Proteiniclasticum sp. BAD-10]|uniref:Amidophosphoribosyltransferase n=1 Tax=Proteiniclasticum sediminis TaxID=2804028 RepID=A0A941CMJ9_9CLOT|nr:amidophosphoribosyltransferase [Proteiniclasticum sediminis]MBR0574817.1 amidophosphoribosyltransferase [Proteiniclasticum sediminis]
MIFLNDKFKEECGVFGLYTKSRHASYDVFDGLYSLQHRGQESAGIASLDKGEMILRKRMGLVSQALDRNDLKELRGNIAIGHVRYSTKGDSSVLNAQPLTAKTKLGSIGVAHNGTLINTEVIRSLLEDSGAVFQTDTDSEVIVNLIARGIHKGLENAVLDAVRTVKGSFALVIAFGNKLIGIRDTYGIRPLVLGRRGEDLILASESCAIDTIGGTLERDIKPGEMVVIENGEVKSYIYSEKTKGSTCSFEYIYFARPDSIMDGISVHQLRVKTGEKLYEEAPVEADVVIGVPDSGLAAAIGYSRASGIPFDIGFSKNKYIGRSFITPSQEAREKVVSLKLNAQKDVVEGKRVVLIDDSIVRGTTSKYLVDLLYRAGAKEVHFRVSSPKVMFPCYFGIDTPYRKHLIAAVMSKDEINSYIGSTSLEYLSREGLVASLGKDSFCTGCFSGIYPLGAPHEFMEVVKNDGL